MAGAIGGTAISSAPPGASRLGKISILMSGESVSSGRPSSDRVRGPRAPPAIGDPTAPLRDLTVFNGYATLTNTETATTNISGFLTPSTGTVNAKFGTIVYEGDAGLSGDYMTVGSTRLADAETWGYVALEVWDARHEDDMPRLAVATAVPPRGEQWDGGDAEGLAARYPRLTERFG